MSSVYAIQFTDSTLPGKTTFTIAPAQHDGPDQLLVLPPHPEKAHTSLTLFGQGALRYGQMIDDNFVHLLENFASDGIEPTLPTIGQTWFDYAVSTLKVFTASGWTLAPGNVISFNFNLLAVTLAPLKLYIAGDQTTAFSAGVNFAVGNDSSFPANNGVYQVISSFWNSGTDQTEITSTAYSPTVPVAQGVPSGQVEVSQQPPSPIIGQVYFDYSTVPPVLTVWDGVTFVPIQTTIANTTLNMNGNSITNLANSAFNIVAVTIGLANAWTISGNHQSLFVVGDTVYVDNNSLNAANIAYTVVASSNSGPNTNITVTASTIPVGSGANGHLANGTGGLNVASANLIYLKIDGSNSPMTGILDMGSHRITNVTDPLAAQDAMTLSFADGRYVNIIGDTMTGSLNFVGAGTAPMDMGTNLIRSVTDPLLAQDAATRNYVLLEISKAVSPLVTPTFQVPGGQTAAYTFTGAGTPVGVITPFGQGNIYIDTVGGKIWIVAHVGGGPVTNLDWRQVYPAIYT